MLGLAALACGLAPFAEVDLPALFAKGSALGALYIDLMEARCGGFGFTLASPREAERRGSHVSYAHPHAHAICQALIARGVVGDFRAPDLLRMGFAPLYTRFEDVWCAIEAIRDVMQTAAWNDSAFHIRARVT